MKVIDLVRSLEAQAPHAGGRVVATMGNHEAECLVELHNDKAMSTDTDKGGINEELAAQHIDPRALRQGRTREDAGARTPRYRSACA